MKKILSIILVILTISSLVITASANPTDSFVHDDTQSGAVTSVLSQDMYAATKVITAASVGLEKSLSGVNDICSDKNGNVYLLVSDWSQVVVLNNDYSLNRILILTDEKGNKVSFSNARGIFVDKDFKIYICDTTHSRVLIADGDGKVVDTWTQPVSPLIPEDFYFQPTSIVRTDKGYTYILSLGCYYGALLYSPEQKFLGFYGANTVKASALDTLSYLWDRLTQTEAKKAQSVKELPFSFVDLCLDAEDYTVTCTGRTEAEKNGTGQIRKLSPTGENIMFKRLTNGTAVSANSVNFVEEKYTIRFGNKQLQNIISIDVDENNFIYALDGTAGLVYIYDEECNLLCGFGGGGDNVRELGLFDSAVALAVVGSDVLISDTDSQNVTVYELTDYGRVLMKAQRAYLDGEYEEAKPLWEEVNRRNKSCQLAYRGLAIAYLSEGNYEQALECAEYGLDYTVYDLAWKVIRNNYILDNFIWLAAIALVLIGAIVAAIVVIRRKKIVLVKDERVKIALTSSLHPFRAFDDVKYKNMGSLTVALVILACFYVVNVLSATGSGFLATTVDIHKYNTLYTLIETVGLILLWSIANWLISSSFNGKGNFKEVLIATTYSLVPLVLFTLIKVLLSHVLDLSGLGIVNAIGTVVIIFTFYLLSVAIMTVHEYDFFKFLLTGIVTVLFMVLVAFVIFLVGVLLQQVGEFFTSVFQEIFYR